MMCSDVEPIAILPVMHGSLQFFMHRPMSSSNHGGNALRRIRTAHCFQSVLL